LASFADVRATWEYALSPPSVRLKQVVNNIADHREAFPVNMRPSFFVTGYTGRKGANGKAGSLALLAAGQFHLPNIIVKNPVPISGRGRVFVASIKSLGHEDPYHVALDLIKPGNGDTLVVLHVYAETFFAGGAGTGALGAGGSATVLARYEKHFKQRFLEDGLGAQAAFLPLVQAGGADIRETILAALDDLKADYLILNPALVVDARHLSLHLIEEASCNVIICKR
jgi:hypothetical protein